MPDEIINTMHTIRFTHNTRTLLLLNAKTRKTAVDNDLVRTLEHCIQ